MQQDHPNDGHEPLKIIDEKLHLVGCGEFRRPLVGARLAFRWRRPAGLSFCDRRGIARDFRTSSVADVTIEQFLTKNKYLSALIQS